MMRSIVFSLSILLTVYIQGNDALSTSDKLERKEKNDTVGIVKYKKWEVDESKPLALRFEMLGRLTSAPYVTLAGGRYFYPTNLTDSNDEARAGYQTYYEQSGNTITVIVVRPTSEYAGEVRLNGNYQTTDGKTESGEKKVVVNVDPIIKKTDQSKRFTQGGTAEFTCSATAVPPVGSYEWKRVHNLDGKTDDAQTRLKMKKTTVEGDTMYIEGVDFADAGYFKCIAHGASGRDEMIVELRVKNRLAPLWPAIGILIEVIILVVAILIYERNRRKNAKKTPQDEQKETLTGGGGDRVGRAENDHGENDAETRKREVKA